MDAIKERGVETALKERIEKIREKVTVKLTDGYLEYFMNGRLIYDIEADRIAYHLPNLREKNWFTPELESKSNDLVGGVSHG